MSKFKRKKNQIGTDSYGLPIYHPDKYHHSSSTLKQYVICCHTCKEHGPWQHKMVPDMECHLSKFSIDYVPCENCITFGLSTTREEKVAMMTDKQKAIIKAWEKMQKERKK